MQQVVLAGVGFALIFLALTITISLKIRRLCSQRRKRRIATGLISTPSSSASSLSLASTDGRYNSRWPRLIARIEEFDALTPLVSTPGSLSDDSPRMLRKQRERMANAKAARHPTIPEELEGMTESEFALRCCRAAKQYRRVQNGTLQNFAANPYPRSQSYSCAASMVLVPKTRSCPFDDMDFASIDRTSLTSLSVLDELAERNANGTLDSVRSFTSNNSSVTRSPKQLRAQLRVFRQVHSNNCSYSSDHFNDTAPMTAPAELDQLPVNARPVVQRRRFSADGATVTSMTSLSSPVESSLGSPCSAIDTSHGSIDDLTDSASDEQPAAASYRVSTAEVIAEEDDRYPEIDEDSDPIPPETIELYSTAAPTTIGQARKFFLHRIEEESETELIHPRRSSSKHGAAVNNNGSHNIYSDSDEDLNANRRKKKSRIDQFVSSITRKHRY